MQGSREKIVKIYVWLMFGLLLCAGITMMKMNGSTDVNHLMNQERVYDFSEEEISKEQEIKKLPEKKKWNYLRIDVDDCLAEQKECTITIYDKNGKVLGEQTTSVCSGKNYVKLSYEKPFRFVGVRINIPKGEQVAIGKMQLRMNQMEFSPNTFFSVFLVLFVSYLVLTAFFVWNGKGTGGVERALELLQYAYTIPGNYLGSRVYGKVSPKKRSLIRSLLFALVFVTGPVMEKSGLYRDAGAYKYGILFQIILLFVIAVLSWEKQLKPGKWHGVLVTSWFLLWIWVCISDFVVSKYFKFTGIIFLTVIGFFFFLWSHMADPEQMTKDMFRGLRFTFLPMLFLIVISQKTESMMLYMLALLLAFLAGIYFDWKEKKQIAVAINVLGVLLLCVLMMKEFGLCLSDSVSVGATEKIVIWENYARNLSFFGNKAPYVSVRGVNTLAYSGWIEMIYRYGVFVVIPYGLFLFSCLWQAVKRREIPMAAVTVVFLLVMTGQNIEMPFLHPLWFLFYLNAGKLFRES